MFYVSVLISIWKFILLPTENNKSGVPSFTSFYILLDVNELVKNYILTH